MFINIEPVAKISNSNQEHINYNVWTLEATVTSLAFLKSLSLVK